MHRHQHFLFAAFGHILYFQVQYFLSVSAVAQQILWNCLIEDPALVLRHFLEKLTVSNRQVGEPLKDGHSFRSDELECEVFSMRISAQAYNGRCKM